MIPPTTERDRAGMQRRVGTFLHAIAATCDTIEMLHIISPATIATLPPDIADRQSAFWGLPLRATLIPRRETLPSTWSHLVQGTFSLTHQHPYQRFTSPDLIATLRTHLATQPTLIYADRLEPMLTYLLAKHRPHHTIFDLNDVEHSVQLGKLRRTKSPLTLAALPALLAAERRATRTASITTVCSELDRAHLKRLRFPGQIEAIPNAVPLAPNPPGLVSAPTILLLGACTYPPNVEAAERLATQIWPLIHQAAPHARLILAGPGTDTLPSKSKNIPGIEYRGFVDDLAALYAETRLVCCPLLTGGGTRLKLVEAASHARPMVSTTKGAEGLDFHNERDILIREQDTDIATACLDLLANDQACLALGQAARQTMATLYDTTSVIRQIETMIERVLAAPPQ